MNLLIHAANDALVAVKVELEEDDVAENDELELEGLITGFATATEFRVFGRAVTTTTATVFEGGTAEDLGDNIKVEVEGAINAVGILVATKVQFKAVEDTRFEALVDLVDVENNEVTVLGIIFSITDSTQLEDDLEGADMIFGLENLVPGNFVEIRGKLQVDDGLVSVITTRLERDDLEDEVSVRGAVQSNDDVTLVIAGVTIQTTPETVYRDALEMSMTKVDFFLAAQTGVEVEAEGQKTPDLASEITATELELEDD